jgi:endonuclease YncB( thermonuclease family)
VKKKILISVGITIAILIGFGVIGSLPSENNLEQNCKGSAGCFVGQVTDVIDGDTLEIDGNRIRLALTSTPELSEDYGIEAKQFTSEFCPIGSVALVDEDDMQTGGSYGRAIGKIFCESGVLNSALLEDDLAYIDEQFCSTSEFASENWAVKYGC